MEGHALELSSEVAQIDWLEAECWYQRSELRSAGFSRFRPSLLTGGDACKWLWPLRKMAENCPQRRYRETNLGRQIGRSVHEFSAAIRWSCMCTIISNRTNNSNAILAFGCDESRELAAAELSTGSLSNHERTVPTDQQ